MFIRIVMVLLLTSTCSPNLSIAAENWRYLNQDFGFTIDVSWRYVEKPYKNTNPGKGANPVTRLLRGDGRAGCYITNYNITSASRVYRQPLRRITEAFMNSVISNDSRTFLPGSPNMSDFKIVANLAEKHDSWSGWRMDFIARPRGEDALPATTRRSMIFVDYYKDDKYRRLLQFFCVVFENNDEQSVAAMNEELMPMLKSITFNPPLVHTLSTDQASQN